MGRSRGDSKLRGDDGLPSSHHPIFSAIMTAPPVFLSSDEPVRSTLLSNIAAQSAVLPTLLNAISAAAVSTSTGGSSSSSNPASSSSSNKSPTAAISAAHNSLVTLDHQLAVLMERARRHQARWQRMLALQEEAVAVESRVRDALIVLESGKRELEGTLKDARVVLAGIETAEKSEWQATRAPSGTGRVSGGS